MMENRKVISVIVPVYNCEKWIVECITSVLKQTFTGYELILVDDGSTDRSGKICDEYAREYEQIRVIHKENGGGAGDARNCGIQASQGEFIVFLDGDDLQDPQMLQKMIGVQNKGDYDLVICGYQFKEEKGKGKDINPEPAILENKEDVLNYFIKYYPDGLMGYPWNKLYRKRIITENNILFPKMRRLEDGIFNVDYIKQVERMGIIPEPLVYYRANSQVILRKLPYDFYDNMRTFSENYYKFLKSICKERSEWEKPFVYYFLNDFVCCVENILANFWPEKSWENKVGDLDMLRQDKMVKYMLTKLFCVPRYSRIVLSLFASGRWKVLTICVYFKLLMKKYAGKLFFLLKNKLNK